MKILIFGGSFDPPHRGHYQLLLAAARKVKPDKIIIVPAYFAPLRLKLPMASARQRADMIRVGMVRKLPSHFQKMTTIDLSEARSKRSVYTVETLTSIQKQFPKAKLHFVCGQDAASSWPYWKNPNKLKQLASWWYGQRPNAAKKMPRVFHRLPGTFPDISSSVIREHLASGHDADEFLMPTVASFIEKNGLYGVGLLKTLKKALKPSRFEHTLNVANLAVSLAKQHGLDPVSAQLAGLLHDVGRKFSPAQMISYVQKYDLKIPARDETISNSPILLHAYISADLAGREFGVNDKNIISAIQKHTLADATMTLFDRVLYVADACSIDRHYKGVKKLRKLAFKNIDEAFIRSMGKKIRFTLRQNSWLHPQTIAAWNGYVQP